ncbi:F-box family protein [Striga asiatica]|uniref:F-box family protein n=1 Tax=Striga asiatica TaxID=4170 RepID=A0A5A7RC98_STRAF|nr:F-box family protein [Striga asiatica]
MLFFLITCSFSFIFFYKSLVLKPLPSWACEMRMLSLLFLKDFSFFSLTKSLRNTVLSVVSSIFASLTLSKKSVFCSQIKSLEKTPEMSLLDLPDLVLETILEKLPPEGLCKMACVCTSFRDWCMSDHLWEKHIKNKWARVVGPAAYMEWQWQIALGKGSAFFGQHKNRGLMGYLNHLWPVVLIRSSLRGNITKKTSFRPKVSTSIMSWYFALESGKFWFPAQVYNRENGHVGFMLSCYDAELCYDVKTNTFQASTAVGPVGERQLSIGQITGRRVLKQMDFTEDFGKFVVMKRSVHGKGYGHLNTLSSAHQFGIKQRNNCIIPVNRMLGRVDENWTFEWKSDHVDDGGSS